MARTKQTARKDHSQVGEKTIPMSQSPPRDYDEDHDESDEEEESYSSDPDGRKAPVISRKVRNSILETSHI